MKNLYIKGFDTNKKELAVIKKIFNDYSFPIEMLFSSYGKFTFESEEQIIDFLITCLQKYEADDPVNLICHSAGCNLGVLLASNTKIVNKLVLISPIFEKVSKEEKLKRILALQDKDYYGENPNYNDLKLNVENVKSFIMFKKTQALARKSIYKLDNKTLIIFSKGDLNVAYPSYDLLAQENFEEASVCSLHHNPLFSKREKTLSLIKNFIYK